MKIALIGYGKMGKAIEAIALERGHTIGLKVTSENADYQPEDLSGCDVAIEFSLPEFSTSNIKKCFEAGVPVVVGTTGWYDEFYIISELCTTRGGAILHATNFSVGVNIFFEINERLASLMNSHEQYQVGMEEIHHTEKLDAPSGTAITLAEGVIKGLDRKEGWKNDEATEENEVLIESKRMKDVPGTHTVKYDSDIDFIEIKHEAKNRKGFALGAVLAGEFLKDKQGIFTMKDVLGL